MKDNDNIPKDIHESLKETIKEFIEIQYPDHNITPSAHEHIEVYTVEIGILFNALFPGVELDKCWMSDESSLYDFSMLCLEVEEDDEFTADDYEEAMSTLKDKVFQLFADKYGIELDEDDELNIVHLAQLIRYADTD